MVMAAAFLSLAARWRAHPSCCLRVRAGGRLCGCIVMPAGPRSHPPSCRPLWRRPEASARALRRPPRREDRTPGDGGADSRPCPADGRLPGEHAGARARLSQPDHRRHSPGAALGPAGQHHRERGLRIASPAWWCQLGAARHAQGWPGHRFRWPAEGRDRQHRKPPCHAGLPPATRPRVNQSAAGV